MPQFKVNQDAWVNYWADQCVEPLFKMMPREFITAEETFRFLEVQGVPFTEADFLLICAELVKRKVLDDKP